jgi:hypothetical protein
MTPPVTRLPHVVERLAGMRSTPGVVVVPAATSAGPLPENWVPQDPASKSASGRDLKPAADGAVDERMDRIVLVKENDLLGGCP